MQTWERLPCQADRGFYEISYIDGDESHFMSVIKYDILEEFIVRYVRNCSTVIQTNANVATLDEAKAYIVRETLKYLYDTAREYDKLHARILKDNI